MSSSPRKITIPLSAPTLGAFLMVAGLAMAVVECFHVPYDIGWAGICVALIGKHLLNRGMVCQINEAVEHQADREIEAFELGRLHRIK